MCSSAITSPPPASPAGGDPRGPRRLLRVVVAVVCAVVVGALVAVPAGEALAPAAAGPSGFTDIRGHWAEAAILQLQHTGALRGYPDGTFRPDLPVRRLEAAAVFTRVLGLHAGPGSLPYSDAAAIPAWAAPSVAAAAPLMQGMPDGRGGQRFAGELPVTRAQLAVIVWRALDLRGRAPAAGGEGSGTPPYRDAGQIPSWAQAAVAGLTRAGMLTGDPGGRFHPQRAATRAELAVLLVRLLERVGGLPGDSVVLPPPGGDRSGQQPGQGNPGRGGQGGAALVVGFYARSRAGDTRGLTSLAAHADVVTMVAEFGFWVDDRGRVQGEPDAQLHDFARRAGIPVLAVIHNDRGSGFDRELVHRILSTPGTAEAAAERIAAFVVQHGYAGVNLDFENIPPGDRQRYTAFVARLADALHPRGLLLTLSVPAKPADDPQHGWSGAFDYPALARLADYIIPMAYDQHWLGSGPGPVAGLPWFSAVASYAAATVPKDRLLLGVAAYGYDWAVSGGDAHAFPSRDALTAAAQRGATVRWDDSNQVPYFTYRQGGVDRIAYFENAHSLRPKLAVARNLGVAGVAIWRLGYEDPQVWPLLQRFQHGQPLTLDP